MQFIWCWNNWRWGVSRYTHPEYGKLNYWGEVITYKGHTDIYLGPMQIRKWR